MKQYKNKELADMLFDLKKKFGITQTAVAKVLDVSVQALTDMKSGRRAFTPPMAEKLLDQYQNEPWAGWLADELKGFVAFIDRPILAAPETDKMIPFDTVVYVPGSEHLPCVPLLRTLILGDHTILGKHSELHVELPRWTIPLIPAGSSPYILELAADDYAGRLRMGDYVLVAQATIPIREIMIVEHGGSLRLARNTMYDAVATGGYGEWLALDSGLPLPNATPAAMVVGVIMARL